MAAFYIYLVPRILKICSNANLFYNNVNCLKSAVIIRSLICSFDKSVKTFRNSCLQLFSH